MTKARNLADNALTTVSPTELGYVDGVTSSIQTQLDAKIAKSTVTAKGDVIAATASATVSNLAVGANDTVLTADSTTATGLKWATPAASGMTLLSTTNLSSTSTTVSSINQTYTELFVVVTNATLSAATKLRIQANGSTSLNKTVGFENSAAAGYSSSAGSVIDVNTTSTSTYLRFANYASTTVKKVGIFASSDQASAGGSGIYFYDSTSAISSITVTTANGTSTFSAGQIQIYGVK